MGRRRLGRGTCVELDVKVRFGASCRSELGCRLCCYCSHISNYIGHSLAHAPHHLSYPRTTRFTTPPPRPLLRPLSLRPITKLILALTNIAGAGGARHMCLRPRAWTPVYSGHRLRGFLPGVWKRIDRADAKHIQLDAEQRPPCVDRREPFRGADLAMSEWRIARAVPDHPLFLGWWTPSVSAERDAAKLGVAARLLDVRADDDEDSRFGEDCGHYEPSPGFEPGTDDRAVDVGVTSTEAWKIAAQGAKP